MKEVERNIVTNIIKIRHSKDIRQAIVATAINVDSSTYCKIESGQMGLSLERLSEIASFFNMRMIDVITYPKRYVNIEELPEEEREKKKPKVFLQMELEEEKREEVLKIILGEENLKIM